MKNSWIIHPFLFSIFPILSLLSHNVEQGYYSDALLALATSFGFSLIVILCLRILFKNIRKIALITSLIIVLFYSYGHIYYLLKDSHINYLLNLKHYYLLAVFGMFFIYFTFLIIKTSKDLHFFTKMLNIASFSLIIFPILNVGIYEFTKRDITDNAKTLSEIESNNTDKFICRDIYYIILDGYASSNTLKKIYKYNNEVFTNYLTEKGFYVAPESRSNYSTTFLSLSSSLNMKYINFLTDSAGENSKDRAVPYKMIRNNKVMNFLASKGYQTINFGSGWGATSYNRYADRNYSTSVLSEFFVMLLRTTMLYPFDKHFHFAAKNKRGLVLEVFSKLAEIYKIEEPTFAFAHIIPPHPPYLFNSAGDPVTKTKLAMSGDVWQEKEKYINQLMFVNKQVQVLVDEILSNSKVPPIIILQADHGSASSLTPGMNYIDLNKNMLRERMEIFNAYYLPAGGEQVLYRSITPVNSFRMILNYYFDSKNELLDDKSYFSTYDHPYKFFNVTEKIKYE